MKYHYHDDVTLHGRKDFADIIKVPYQVIFEFTSKENWSWVGIISSSECLKEIRDTKRDSSAGLEGANCHDMERAKLAKRHQEICTQGSEFCQQSEWAWKKTPDQPTPWALWGSEQRTQLSHAKIHKQQKLLRCMLF